MKLKSQAEIDKATTSFAGIEQKRKEVLALTARNTSPEKYGELLHLFRGAGNAAEARFVESLFDDVPPTQSTNGNAAPQAASAK